MQEKPSANKGKSVQFGLKPKHFSPLDFYLFSKACKVNFKSSLALITSISPCIVSHNNENSFIFVSGCTFLCCSQNIYGFHKAHFQQHNNCYNTLYRPRFSISSSPKIKRYVPKHLPSRCLDDHISCFFLVCDEEALTSCCY